MSKKECPLGEDCDLTLAYMMGAEKAKDTIIALRKRGVDQAAEIDRLRKLLDDLLAEAEDVFACMADATGIDRHTFPDPYLAAQAELERHKETGESNG